MVVLKLKIKNQLIVQFIEFSYLGLNAGREEKVVSVGDGHVFAPGSPDKNGRLHKNCGNCKMYTLLYTIQLHALPRARNSKIPRY